MELSESKLNKEVPRKGIIVQYENKTLIHGCEVEKAGCKTLLDLKQMIFEKEGFEINTQILSIENTLISDQTELSLFIQKGDDCRIDTGVNKKLNGIIQDSNRNGFVVLKLQVAFGKCTLKIILIAGEKQNGNTEVKQQSIDVPSSSSNLQVQEQIIAAYGSDIIPKNTKLIVFFRKKMINDHGWLFEQLIDSLNLATPSKNEENDLKNDRKNSKEIIANASKANTCDQYFV